MNEKRGEEEINPLTSQYSARSLTLIGLVMASIVFFITNYKDSYEDVLFVLVFSFGLFILSYRSNVFTGIKEIYLVIQDRLIIYGVFSLMLGLFLYFWDEIRLVSYILILFIIISVIMHIFEILNDLSSYE